MGEEEDGRVTWITFRVRLVDQSHRKPDRIRAITITYIVPLQSVLDDLEKIRDLINEGYVIEELIVFHG